MKKADRARYEAGGRRIFLRLSEQRRALNLMRKLCTARPAFERAAMQFKAESGRGGKNDFSHTLLQRLNQKAW